MKKLSRADALKLLPGVEVPENVAKRFAEAGIMTKVVATDALGNTTVTYPWQMGTFASVPDEVLTTLYTELRNFVLDYAEREKYIDLDESQKKKFSVSQATALYEMQRELLGEPPRREITTKDMLDIFASSFARRFIYQWRRYQ